MGNSVGIGVGGNPVVVSQVGSSEGTGIGATVGRRLLLTYILVGMSVGMAEASDWM